MPRDPHETLPTQGSTTHPYLFPLIVGRSLLLGYEQYLDLQESIRNALPENTPASYCPLEHAGIVYLSQPTLNKAARRSHNFYGMSFRRLKERLWESMPNSKSSVYKASVARRLAQIRRQGSDEVTLALRFINPSRVRAEQLPLFSELDRITKGHANVRPHPHFPFLPIVRFSGVDVPPEAQSIARETAASLTLIFDRVELIDAIPTQPQPGADLSELNTK